jgi:hypothetical protein
MWDFEFLWVFGHTLLSRCWHHKLEHVATLLEQTIVLALVIPSTHLLMRKGKHIGTISASGVLYMSINKYKKNVYIYLCAERTPQMDNTANAAR